MDIEINEVQEIIKNLESSGELSIKEEKYLKVAKLCVQLAEENVVMKEAIPKLKNIDYQNESMDDVTLAEEIGFNAAIMAMHRWAPKTPATDRIVAWIKSDGVEEWVYSRGGRWNGTTEEALKFAKQLREGAVK